MKRRHMMIPSLAIAALVVTAALAAAPIDAVLEPYFRIQAQLADDKTDSVKADAETLAQAASALGAPGEAMAAAARELSAAAPELAAAREAFGKLSDALVVYADNTHAAVGSDVATVYCPMVKKSWLQKGDAIRNPYFGKGMLGCGQIRKKG